MKIVFFGDLARSHVTNDLDANEFKVVPADSIDDLEFCIPDADVLVITGPHYSAHVALCVKSSSRLQLVQLTSSGFENIQRYGVPAGVSVCNAPDAWSEAVAEHSLAMMLQLSRRSFEAYQQQQEKLWRRDYTARCTTLFGKTLLIVGYGRIGKCIAKLARAFSMHVIAVSNSARVSSLVKEVVSLEDLSRAVSRAHIVVTTLPSAPKTINIFDAELFDRFRSDALFINVGRGDTVNLVDLEQALHKGAISAAALDVTMPEPLPPDSELWNAPNLIITPHVAGALPDLVPFKIRDIVVDNILRLRNGLALNHLVLS